MGDNKALSDCHSVLNGCSAVVYTDPNHLYAGPSCTYPPAPAILAVASESWFIHDTGYSDSSHRVYGVWSSGCYVWEMNPNEPAYQAWWLSYLRNNADSYDLYFADDDYMKLSLEAYFSHFGGGCQPLPTMCTSTQEIPDDAHQVLAHANFFNAMSHSNGSPMRFIFQNTSFDGALDASAFGASSRVVGMTCEACVTSIAYPTLTNLYGKTMDEIATVHQAGGVFVLIAHGNSPTGSAMQTLQRVLTTAFTWLVYQEGYTVVWPDLELQNNNLAVWPEDLIYPSAPLQSMITGHLDLQAAPGIYRREFSKCYQKGLYIAQCAALVNANSSAVTVAPSWLTQTYHHVVALSGGDVLSGGSALLSAAPFVAGTTQIQAGAALLLVP